MIVIAIAIGIVLPAIFLRGGTLLRCIAIEVAAAAIVVIAGRVAPRMDDQLAAAAVGALIVIIVSIAVATARDVRWSATRAAFAALLVYLCVIPAMQRTPIDGDEPYYLLVTDSLLHDRDLDLRNQYRDSTRLIGRALEPQPSDPVGRNGEQYSRHEPFLPLLLVPGYAIGGLTGALVTIALFAALAVRSTIRLLEDEGVGDAPIRALYPFLAFGPPLLFYAVRIWPEAPAAFAFAEVLRGVRQRRGRRWIAALFGLVLLKLRFVLVAFMVGVGIVAKRRRGAGAPLSIVIVAIVAAVAIVWIISGSMINVHSWEELKQFDVRDYLRGIFGLMLDGAGGLLFQAPFYLLGVFAIARWRSTPEAFRLGWLFAALYLFLLVPRSEWHGGWSPPLRYITFFMPVLALGAASVWNRVAAPVVVVIAAWTAGVAVHGIAFPWRLFHIANGENPAGEWLSAAMHADFSRLFPSFIRPNVAAIVAALMLGSGLLALGSWELLARPKSQEPTARSRAWVLPLVALLALLAFQAATRPAALIHLEDAHVIHRGGELYPPMYTVARFNYRGGWTLRAGDSVSFLARGGRSRLDYSAAAPAAIQIGATAYQLDAKERGSAVIQLPENTRVELTCLSGTITIDAIRCQIGD